jgi:peptidoglycan/LPS O-acetylase OafA/YrhL
MGRMSFGLYAIHAPIFVLARVLCPADAPLPARALVFAAALAFAVLAALAAERWIDAPARRWAKRRTEGRRPAAVIA